MSFKNLAEKTNAHQEGIWSVAWTKNDAILTGSLDKSISIWGFDAGSSSLEQKTVWAASHRLGVVSVSATYDGTLACSTSMDGVIVTMDLATNKLINKTEKSPGHVWTTDCHPSRHHVAVGTYLGSISTYDATTGESVGRYDASEGKGAFSMCVRYSPNGKYIAVGQNDGQVVVFDVETQAMVCKLSGHNEAVRSVVFSADSTRILAGSQDHHISVYEIASGEQVQTLYGHQSWVLDLDVSPGCDFQFASSSSDRTVKLWDARALQAPLHTFASHKDQVWSIAYSPDGKKLASVCEDGSLHISETVSA